MLGCPQTEGLATENNYLQSPVDGVSILFNKNPVPVLGITLIEGRSGILGVMLEPAGVQGGVHWQSSNGSILELSGFSGQEITVTAKNGGKTIIFVTARNTLNEIVVGAECIINVIPKTFFKWNYLYADWMENPVLEAQTNYYIYDAGFPMLIRTGDTEIYSDMKRGGIVLEGAGAKLLIGSGMATATNSPFEDHPVYDKNGQFDFLNGPQGYELWAGRVRVSVEYEMLDADSFLRIQVNNNTLQRNASAINNSFVTELTQSSASTGILTGIFDNSLSALSTSKKDDIPGSTDAEKKDAVLSRSFVCLALPQGKILLRGIRIESAD